jgi:hypothetical protein
LGGAGFETTGFETTGFETTGLGGAGFAGAGLAGVFDLETVVDLAHMVNEDSSDCVA